MKLLILALALASVGCASKPSKATKEAAVVSSVSKASTHAKSAKKSVSAASKASTTTGDAVKTATDQNQQIEKLLEELVNSL